MPIRFIQPVASGAKWLWAKVRARPTAHADRQAVAAARDISVEKHLISSKTAIINEYVVQIQNLDKLILQDAPPFSPSEVTQLLDAGKRWRAEGEHHRALTCLWDALRQQMDDRSRIRLHNNIGLTHADMGEYDLAKAHLLIGRYLARGVGDLELVAKISAAVSYLASRMNEWASAAAAHEEAAAIYRGLSQKQELANHLCWLAESRCFGGDYDGAIPPAQESRGLYRELQQHAGEVKALRAFAEALIGKHEFTQAKSPLLEAVQVARNHEMSQEEGDCLRRLEFIDMLEAITISTDEQID
jgi:hypothetical protein